MEIVGKFRAAMEGFWWALDDQEKRVLIVWTAYLVGSILLSVNASHKERERERITAEVLERIRG